MSRPQDQKQAVQQMCFQKRRFENQGQADAMARYLKKLGRESKAVACSNCGGWHVIKEGKR